MKEERSGSNFDDFLREEHLLEASKATAAKRVIAHWCHGQRRLTHDHEPYTRR